MMFAVGASAVTGAMRAGAATREASSDSGEQRTPAATQAPARAQVEQALEAMLGLPVSLSFRKNTGQLTLHFRTADDVETVLRTLLAAGITKPSGVAPAAGSAAPSMLGPRDLRLVTTVAPGDARHEYRPRGRSGTRNVAAYGPRPDPVRQ